VIASDGAPKDPRRCQLLELLRHGARGRAADPDQLADVKRLVRVSEEPAQQLPPGLAEEDSSGVGDQRRTHIAYDCTRKAYGVAGAFTAGWPGSRPESLAGPQGLRGDTILHKGTE